MTHTIGKQPYGEAEKQLYGQGWAFPLRVDTAGVAMVSGVDSVRQSLTMLFRTIYCERIMRMEYGNDLLLHMFDNVDESLLAKIRQSITDSITQNEPRVRTDRISIQTGNGQRGQLEITIHYRLFDNDAPQRLSGILDIFNGFTGEWQ